MNKKLLRLFFVIIILFITISCEAKTEELKISTGSTGGTYYPLGSTIAENINDNLDDVSINAYTGNASVENCKLVNNKDVDLALVQSNVAYWAINNIGMFKDENIDSISGITSLYSETIQIIVRSESNIKSIEELKGKSISIGAKDSGNYFDAINILNSYGVSEEEIIPFYCTFSEAIEQMKNGNIDAVFITSGVPTTSVSVISSKVDIDLLTIDKIHRDQLMEKEIYYTYVVIPANTYLGVDYEVKTLGMEALLICNESLSEDLVYKLTKQFWENSDELSQEFVQCKDLDLNSAHIGMSIPLHPGAIRFYEENK